MQLQQNTDRIQTTHIGSLPRPQRLLDAMKAKYSGQSYDERAYADTLHDSVSDVVREQVQCGIDIVTDGEFSKPGFFTYVRERLDALKLESFAKLSGGKGIHVVVPVAGADWDTTKNFSQRIALGMAADSPQRYVGKMTKALRKGKIFIDYFRNTREATSVAPYSTRARPGAAVSAPLSWDELGRTKSAADFTVLNLKKHFRNDPWADIGKVRQKLPAK